MPSSKKNNFHLVGDLPGDVTNGLRMSTTSKGDNVILTHKKSIYTLSISGSKYSWIKKDQELSISRLFHVQFLVPASMIEC